MKKTLIVSGVAALAAATLFCVTGGDYKPKWTIVSDPQGNYGYVDWDGFVKGEYKTCEAARVARDTAKKWSDDYDTERAKKKSAGYYKKVDCK